MHEKNLAYGILIAGLCLFPVVAQGALVTTPGPVRSVDNIPPAPATNLRAIDTPDDTGGSITLFWTLSADDKVTMSSFGDFVIPRGGLQGYRIYRRDTASAEGEKLLATVASRTTSYVDNSVKKGIRYSYSVRPFDQDNETDLLVQAGSAEDLARIATAIDNTYIPPPPVVAPTDKDGLPIVGWFTHQGDRVGFDDFFLFADHFGLRAGDSSFDPLFDIVPNGKIDFDDFFLFADNFGKAIANADEVRKGLGL